MKKPGIILLLSLLLLSAQSPAQSGYRRVRLIAGKNELKALQLAEILPDHYHLKNGVLEMEINADEFKTLKKLKIDFLELTAKNPPPDPVSFEEQLRQTATAPFYFSIGSMGGYYTYAEAMVILDDMRTRFPSLVSAKDTLGYTHEGRPLVAVRISDNPGLDEPGEDEWLMTSLHHSNEVMGMSVLFYYVWYLLENYNADPAIRKLLNNSSLFIIPVVNPDGLAYNESTNPAGGGTWRKNRKPRVIGSTTHYGVDLNRNYEYNWGYTHSGQLGQAGSNFAGNSYYRGTAPWSEQETSILRDFCQSRNFTAAFNYHAWDDSFNYPWNYDVDSLTDDQAIFTAIAQYCTEDNGFEYGTFNQTLGYSANGTSDDWLYGEQISKNKIFAFTIEVGKSFYPAPGQIIPYCDSLLNANLKMLKMAARYAELTETSSDTITALLSQASFSIKRYSIKAGTFTVSLEPLNAPDVGVTVTGPPVVYADLSFLEQRPGGSISFSVPPATANGTVIRFLLKVDNGTWSVTDTISKIFMGHNILSLGCENSVEPNESMNHAVPLLPGIPMSAAIENVNDQDWFYIDTENDNDNIRVVLSGLPADFDMELKDAAGNLLGLANNPFKLNDTIVYNGAKSGRYFLRIVGYNRNFDSQRCYFLESTISHTRFPELHRNGTKHKSNRETIGYAVSPVPASDQVTVKLSANKPQQISWLLTDNAGRVVLTGQETFSAGTYHFPLMLGKLSSGIYVLKILSKQGYWSPLSMKIVKE